MKKGIITVLLLISALIVLIVYDYRRFHDGLLHVTFCDVGQGDAVFIRTPERKNILLDGGPDKSVLNCLSRYMPFWDKTIHKMILSHPHDDHFFGIHFVLERYNVLSFDTEDLFNDTPGFKELSNEIKLEKAKTNKLFAGNKLNTTDGIEIEIISPSRTYLDLVSPNRLIAERGEQASVISHLKFNNFDIYLASDNDFEIIDFTFEKQNDPIEVLQVPHHGSRYGLTDELVNKINPKLAVISVGKNNYSHPHNDLLKILKDKGIRTLRTDKSGDIEIVTDGVFWRVVDKD